MPLPSVNFTNINERVVTPLALANTVLFVIKAQDGTIGEIIHSGTGSDASVSATGDPYLDSDYVIKIITGGARDTATFRYSRDSGVTWSEEFTTAAGNFDVEGGTFIQFADDTYIADDTYSFFARKGFRKRVIQKLNSNDYRTKITNTETRNMLDTYFTHASECYAIAPPNNIPGSIIEDSSGTGTIEASGEPAFTGELKFRIITTGGLGTGTYLAYIDGNQQTETPQLLSEYIYIEGANVTLKLTAGTFTAGDEWVYSLTAAGSTSMLLALSSNLSSSNPPMLVNVAMDPTFTNVVIPYVLTEDELVQVRALMQQRFDRNNFTGYVLQGRKRGITEDADEYKTAMETYTSFFNDYKCCIVTSYADVGTPTTPNVIPGSILLAVKIATTPVNIDAGRVGDGPLPMYQIYDFDNMILIQDGLDEARYTQIIRMADELGEVGTYFGNTKVFSETGSTFRYYFDIRMYFLALKTVANILYGYLNTTVGILDDGTLAAISSSVESTAAGRLQNSVPRLKFAIVSTAQEIRETGVVNCKMEVGRLSIFKQFDVESKLTI